MERLADVMIRTPSGSSLGEMPTCPRCGQEGDFNSRGDYLLHSCCTCLDGQRIRRSRLREEQGFGLSVPCPDCVRRVMPVAVDLPRRYASARLQDFDVRPDREAYDAARRYVVSWPPAKPLLLLGSTTKGNGKTMLAAGILRDAAERHGVAGRFYNTPELLERLRSAQRLDGLRESIETEVQGAALLVLDEIGFGRQTDFATEWLYVEVNRRYSHGLPLVLTTNEWDRLDDRIRSRLGDRAVAVAVEMKGPDRRVG